jgi:hypothetical protein
MVKMNTMFGYSVFLTGILGDNPCVISLILGLVTCVGHPNCDISVCYFPKKSKVRGAYIILSHGSFFKYFTFTISLPFDVT